MRHMVFFTKIIARQYAIAWRTAVRGLSCGFFLLALTAVCCPQAAAALSNDLRQKMVKEAPELHQAEVGLSNAWKALMGRLQGNERKIVVEEQREWLRSERADHARSLKQRRRISDAQAYAEATIAQARKIRMLLEQIAGSKTNTRIRGKVVSKHDVAGYFYALRAPDVWMDYNIGYVRNFKEGTDIADLLKKAVDSGSGVQATGVLTSLHNLTLKELALDADEPPAPSPARPSPPLTRLLPVPAPAALGTRLEAPPSPYGTAPPY